MSTGSSSSPTSRLALSALALALIISLARPADLAVAAESLEFELVPAAEEFFAPEGTQPAGPTLEAGHCLVIFRHNRLSAGDLNRIALTSPDGRELPLFVEPLFIEFGKIADARMAFRLPESEAEAGRGPFTLKWGPEVNGRNTRVERLAADPARQGLYRTLRLKPGALPGEANIARLEVIADSTAEYHFVWYLLPVGLLFALLMFRKISGRGETGPTGS